MGPPIPETGVLLLEYLSCDSVTCLFLLTLCLPDILLDKEGKGLVFKVLGHKLLPLIDNMFVEYVDFNLYTINHSLMNKHRVLSSIQDS